MKSNQGVEHSRETNKNMTQDSIRSPNNVIDQTPQSHLQSSLIFYTEPISSMLCTFHYCMNQALGLPDVSAEPKNLGRTSLEPEKVRLVLEECHILQQPQQKLQAGLLDIWEVSHIPLVWETLKTRVGTRSGEGTYINKQFHNSQ